MGIGGLWDILGDGTVTSIAALSTQHYQRTGRPFRIAIDEAGWRFNNLTDAQVAFIRTQSKRESNPVEKAIFFRLCKLLRLNVQPIFIFDGPGRPWKRGKHGGSKVDYDRTRLLIKLLDALSIPHHHAPAEAEAECARLQQAGIVDAVWSDDGDTLMFGATMLIKEVREGGGNKKGGKKSDSHIRVYTAHDLKLRHGLDWKALVAFAVMSGGDYDTSGLPGCGPIQALEAVRWCNGLLGEMLVASEEYDLCRWRMQVAECFKALGTPKNIPSDYPKRLAVKHYRTPKTSTAEQLYNLHGLRRGWDTPVKEKVLRMLVRDYLNLWTRGYISHIVPVLFIQRLRRGISPTDQSTINIQLSKKRRKKATEDVSDLQPSLENKITYDPLGVSELDLTTQPEEEDWTELHTKSKGAFNPRERIEMDVLDYLLESGLESDAFRGMQLEGSAPASQTCSLQAVDSPNKEPSYPARPPDRKRSPDGATSEESVLKKRKTDKASPRPLIEQVSPVAAIDFSNKELRAAVTVPGRRRLIIPPALRSDTRLDEPPAQVTVGVSRTSAAAVNTFSIVTCDIENDRTNNRKRTASFDKPAAIQIPRSATFIDLTLD